MALAKDEHDRLAALPQADKNTSIQNDVDVIHRSVNSGSTDRDSVNAALERIVACIKAEYNKLTGTPKPLGTPPAPTYRAPGTPAPQVQPLS